MEFNTTFDLGSPWALKNVVTAWILALRDLDAEEEGDGRDLPPSGGQESEVAHHGGAARASRPSGVRGRPDEAQARRELDGEDEVPRPTVPRSTTEAVKSTSPPR